MNRTSAVRQTRSRTRAVAEDTPNLQNDEQRENASVKSSEGNFEASLIDEERADERECGACDRPNKAEWFMVQCGDCEKWYHFSCAGVTHKTVHSKSFTCAVCETRTSIPPPTSMSVRTSTSSSRRARLARELQRLEEEHALQERIQQATLEKLDREKEYIARKYQLLEQRDEADTSSFRSDSSSQTSRVNEWVQQQNSVVAVTSAVVQQAACVESSHAGTGASVSRKNVQITSTPLKMGFCYTNPKVAESRPVSSIGGVADSELEKTFGSITIDGIERPVECEGIVPLVDVQPLVDLLEYSPPKIPETGALPKNPMPLYEKWRRETNDLRKEHYRKQQQHEIEIEIRRKRELDLVSKLNQLKDSQEEQFELQRRREADLFRQLQLREKEEKEIEKRQRKALEERDAELQRLREIERAFTEMQMSARQKRSSACDPNANAIAEHVQEKAHHPEARTWSPGCTQGEGKKHTSSIEHSGKSTPFTCRFIGSNKHHPLMHPSPTKWAG
nr:uncharacterized protein LOC115256476 [Aedes albopictus]